MSLAKHAARTRRALGGPRRPKHAPRPAPRPLAADEPDERGLLERGRRLWTAIGVEADSVAGAVALEACRTADRLERLDRALAGGDWFEADETYEGSGRWELVINKPLTEARQQQLALKQLLVPLGLASVAREASPPARDDASPSAAPAPAAPKVTNPLDQLQERRAAKATGA